MLTLTLVISTMNRPKTVLNFLDNIKSLSHEDQPDEIILIDQSDVHMNLSGLNQKIPTIVLRQEVASLTKARNLGISKATGEILLFSDDDVVIPDGVISKIRKEMSLGKVGLIAGIDLNTRINSRFISYLTLSKTFQKRNIGHVTKSVLGMFPNTYTDVTNTEWAMGYFFAVRNSFIQRSGIYFDENLKGYAYAEDLDFTYRYCKFAISEGYLTYFDSEIAVYHLGSLEYREPSITLIRMFVFHRYYLSLKLFNSKSSLVAVTIHNLFVSLERLIKLDKNFYLYFYYSFVSLTSLSQLSKGVFKSFGDGQNV